jgi:hypothetical protein
MTAKYQVRGEGKSCVCSMTATTLLVGSDQGSWVGATTSTDRDKTDDWYGDCESLGSDQTWVNIISEDVGTRARRPEDVGKA